MDNMRQIKHGLKELRPSLRSVAPLTFYISLGFAILNLVLGASLAFQRTVGNVAIVSEYTPIWLYGWIFILLGITGLLTLARNNWRWIRRILLFGVAYKSVWLYALLIGLFDGGSIAIVALWLFLTYVQVMTYVFFAPTTEKEKGANSVSTGYNNSPDSRP